MYYKADYLTPKSVEALEDAFVFQPQMAGSLPVEIRKAVIIGCGEAVNVGDYTK